MTLKTPIEDKAQAPEFNIQRIYTKDLSFEAPGAPQIFQQDWQPELNLELHTHTSVLAEGIHEVILSVTVTAKSSDKTAFLVEVKEAGIFTIKNFPAEQLPSMLGSICPSILFPYAREVVSEMVVRGGFPPLYLAPVNFEALYAQHLQQAKQQAQTTEE